MNQSFTRRRWLVDAASVRQVREALGMSQGEFAEALGVARRTVIRGELRGLELPWRSESPRRAVYEAWGRLAQLAADRRPARSRLKCHRGTP